MTRIKGKAKPEGSNWTAEQWQAISARGEDILVAAAAGSGKTAVLVERVISLLVDEQNPLEVDRLLVVTFTEAAAAEMRKRIGEALEQAVANNPGSYHLRQQLALLNRAAVSTLHAFCLQVVRRNYYLLDLDPNFRVANETEGELLQETVLQELFEEEYSRGEAGGFYELADRFSSDRSDLALQQVVEKLYDFSRSHPWPDYWLEEMIQAYQIVPGTVVDDLPWGKDLLLYLKLQLNGVARIAAGALQIACSPGGPAPYRINLEEDQALVADLIKAADRSWEALGQAFQAFGFSTLKRIKTGGCDPALQEKVKKMRGQVKDQLQKIGDTFFGRPLTGYLGDLNKLATVLEKLVELVTKFAGRYRQAKLERGIVDFADLEHYCLAILRGSEATPQLLLCSEAAQSYQKQFAQVMVDEYQDINLVQETILQLVTRNNLFMVGDVKQSIYRFRLAEPELFLAKYKLFQKDGLKDDLGGAAGTAAAAGKVVPVKGLRIDLAKNFRSREEVLAGVNFLFKQMLDETVGEMDYDQDAELVPGAGYPPAPENAVELHLIDRERNEITGTGYITEPGSTGENMPKAGDSFGAETRDEERETEQTELETAQLEARLIAGKIKELVGGPAGKPPLQVFDHKLGQVRRVQYRDMVVLLRATKQWAPIMLEEFKQQGIPAYAELTTGYFQATEIGVMLSILKVIDNPFQDIPLAAVLRSQVVGLTGDELAQIRLQDRKGSYYEAVKAYLALTEQDRNEYLYEKLVEFYQKLAEWRTGARQGALAELIWQIYRETGYYDLVGGMPGGNQRQANLRVLYDRACQYEKTSFRGLFRFLRFIERLQDRGGDLAAARALGEQEDVVRMMTIHKSKGLEFPVVIVAGLGKQFNFQDLHGSILLHKKLGIGARFIDPQLRISYPTLPQLAVRERLRLELLAEEMRLLYVAMTRAKEKLLLVGTVKNIGKKADRWGQYLAHDRWVLPGFERVRALTYLDWLGPAVMRHRNGIHLRDLGNLAGEEGTVMPEVYRHLSHWQVNIWPAITFARRETGQPVVDQAVWEAVLAWQSVDVVSSYREQVARQLAWQYPHQQATRFLAKQTVTELKRRWEENFPTGEQEPRILISGQQVVLEQKKIFREQLARPRFRERERPTAAERGTAMHLVMQQVDLAAPLTKAGLEELVTRLVGMELLTREQAEVVNIDMVLNFFAGELGRRLLNAQWAEREIPFSLAVPAAEVYPGWTEAMGGGGEPVLIQGVIDCVFAGEQGLVLLDYKTDQLTGRFPGGWQEAREMLVKRYQAQIDLYSRAVEKIWRETLPERYVYFFDGGHLLRL